MSGVPKSEAVERFEAWMEEQGYLWAVDGAPHDSREGG